MGFYPRGAPAACYLKRAGSCFQEGICVVVFWSQRPFVGRLLAGPRSDARGCAFWPVEAGIAPGNGEIKGSQIDSSVLA